MNFDAISNGMHTLFERFFQAGQVEVIVIGLVLWVLLRRLLPGGSQYVLKQTSTFFVLCLFGQFYRKYSLID